MLLKSRELLLKSGHNWQRRESRIKNKSRACVSKAIESFEWLVRTSDKNLLRADRVSDVRQIRQIDRSDRQTDQTGKQTDTTDHNQRILNNVTNRTQVSLYNLEFKIRKKGSYNYTTKRGCGLSCITPNYAKPNQDDWLEHQSSQS